MSTAVLGGAKAVGGVVVALVGHPLKVHRELEALRGRPVDRVPIVGMAEVNHHALGEGEFRLLMMSCRLAGDEKYSEKKHASHMNIFLFPGFG